MIHIKSRDPRLRKVASLGPYEDDDEEQNQQRPTSSSSSAAPLQKQNIQHQPYPKSNSILSRLPPLGSAVPSTPPALGFYSNGNRVYSGPARRQSFPTVSQPPSVAPSNAFVKPPAADGFASQRLLQHHRSGGRQDILKLRKRFVMNKNDAASGGEQQSSSQESTEPRSEQAMGIQSDELYNGKGSVDGNITVQNEDINNKTSDHDSMQQNVEYDSSVLIPEEAQDFELDFEPIEDIYRSPDERIEEESFGFSSAQMMCEVDYKWEWDTRCSPTICGCGAGKKCRGIIEDLNSPGKRKKENANHQVVSNNQTSVATTDGGGRFMEFSIINPILESRKRKNERPICQSTKKPKVYHREGSRKELNMKITNYRERLRAKKYITGEKRMSIEQALVRMRNQTKMDAEFTRMTKINKRLDKTELIRKLKTSWGPFVTSTEITSYETIRDYCSHGKEETAFIIGILTSLDKAVTNKDGSKSRIKLFGFTVAEWKRILADKNEWYRHFWTF